MATFGGVRFHNFFYLATKKWTFGHRKYLKKNEKKIFFLEIFMMAKSPIFSGQIKKVMKADPPKSGRSLPATEPVFNFEHYLVWFGNHPKPKSGFSQWILSTFFRFSGF